MEESAGGRGSGPGAAAVAPLTRLCAFCLTRCPLTDASLWIVDSTDSQASRGETSKGEDQPQPGQAEEPPGGPAGKGAALSDRPTSPPFSCVQPGPQTLCNCSFFCRKRPSAEWRRRRFWNTLFSFYRTREARRGLELLQEPTETPSKMASQTAWTEPLASWEPRGKACSSGRRCSRPSLLPLPAQTRLLQAARRPATCAPPPPPPPLPPPPPPPPSCSGPPADPSSTCGCRSRAPCRACWCSAAFRSLDSLRAASPPSR